VVTVLESDMERPQKLREARICSRAQVQNETGDPIRGPALSPANSYGGKPAKIPVLGGGKSNTAMCPQISGNTDLVDFLGTPHEHRAQIALAPLRSPFVLCVCVRVQAEKWLDENDPKRVEVIKAEKKSAAKRLQVTPTLYLSPGL
jgi:hypothetical protein